MKKLLLTHASRRALLLCAALLPLGGMAQPAYPARPVSVVVPYSPGGTTDIIARLAAQYLGASMNKTFVVENKPGASGTIAMGHVARATPDGYTLLSNEMTQTVVPALFSKLSFDPIKDLTGVAIIAEAPYVLVVSAKLPVNTLAELVSYAKANPGKVNFASGGAGSGPHIAGELLKSVAGIEMTHIAYKGSGPAVQDLMGGQVDLFITTPAGVVSQIQSGRLKGIAVTSKQRLSSMPNIPTAAESGLKGYELDSWFALYAPAGTPADIVQLLNAEVGRILASAETRRKAEDSGTAVELMTPVQLGEFTRKELDYWGRVIKGARITLE